MTQKFTANLTTATSDEVLYGIERRVGKPPRRMSWLRLRAARSDAPSWAAGEPLMQVFAVQGEIIRNGEVRWAHVVQANNSIFAPGPIDLPGQVVYSIDDGISLGQLEDIAQRFFRLKETPSSNQEQRELGEMLARELGGGVAKLLPASLTDGREVFTTDFVFPRRHMPGGILAMSHVPVFADPKTRMAIMINDCYWPVELRDEWQQLANNAIKRWKAHEEQLEQRDRQRVADQDASNPPVTLTSAAAAQIRDIIQEQKIKDCWLRIVASAGEQGGFSHELGFTSKPDPSRQLVYEHQGVPITIDQNQIKYLVGTTIDFRSDGSSRGFTFDNPNTKLG